MDDNYPVGKYKGAGNASLGSTTDAPASVSVDEDGTASNLVKLLKGSKNLLIDISGFLSDIKAKFGTLTDGQAPVVAGWKQKRIEVSFTAIGAYSQYDNVGGLVEIPNWAAANGRGAAIKEIRLSCDNNAIVPQFEMHFFNASNPTVAADNAPWTELAADYVKRSGYVILPVMAKSTGSGTIDMIRCQSDDYGQSLGKEVCCAAGSTSAWVALKLLTSGITFANSPGNAIKAAIIIEQS